MISDHMKHYMETLLRPGERINWSLYPWPKPKVGDSVRAVVLFDRDPGDTLDEPMLERKVSDCTVWGVFDSDHEEGVSFVHFRDADGLPLPTEISKSAKYEHQQTWAGVEVWYDHRAPSDLIPCEAIQRALLHDYAAILARRSENIEKGLYS